MASAEEKLKNIRSYFSKQATKLDAYIINSYDQHLSEYVPLYDNKIQYLTGFTGPTGIAIVTEEDACLWVGCQFYAQAVAELQAPFQLMESENPDVSSKTKWLINNYPNGGLIGACGKYFSISFWTEFIDELNTSNMKVVDLRHDIVEQVWNERPPRIYSEIVPYCIDFSGQAAGDKIKAVRLEMTRNRADMLVISNLEEIAWVLNLRGDDVPYNPVFWGFLIIKLNCINIFVNSISENGKNHLQKEGVQLCIYTYDEFYDTLFELGNSEHIKKVWLPQDANQRIFRSVNKKKVYIRPSPIATIKSIKNRVEVSGMTEAHVYDGYAMCKFFCWLHKVLKRNQTPTEMSAIYMLEDIKKKNSDYIGPSLRTVSAGGQHSAIVNYEAVRETNKTLSLQDIYLCRAGSQYMCGTTIITRTFHFGDPTEFQKECYTRIFKGQANLSMAIFPDNTDGSTLDVLARQHLWEAGLNYAHTTGYGVGVFLNINDDVVQINHRKRNVIGLTTDMYVTNNPGYYETNSFGISLENVEHVRVSGAGKKHGMDSLCFETASLCPYQTSMIIPSLLTIKELNYLNSFHLKVRNILAPVYKSENDKDVYNWVMSMTEPLVF